MKNLLKYSFSLSLLVLTAFPAVAYPTAAPAGGKSAAAKSRGSHANHGYSSYYYYGPYATAAGSGGGADVPKKDKRLGDKGVVPTYNKKPLADQKSESQLRSSKVPGLVDKP